ncbi:hypothetical protein CEXT_222891 [Caerostris extrusa]|uniref:Uncharacterized protein n=1 Tax=Caerostris extrusa TaxID=172846 RepID=A0AAV4NMI8_CAEEX|nr:hypothetical protein CEXT_222891 [Caerostris extrusa]
MQAAEAAAARRRRKRLDLDESLGLPLPGEDSERTGETLVRRHAFQKPSTRSLSSLKFLESIEAASLTHFVEGLFVLEFF